MLGAIAVIFVFSGIILAHEFGHFLMAKRCGVKVERFSMGFGPEIWGFQKGDTRYSICLVLFGGYIKMAGDDPREELGKTKGEFLSQPIFRRLLIVAAGPIFNYVLAFLIFFFIFVIGSPTITSKIGGIIEGFPAQAHHMAEGDKIIAIDGRPVEYWDELTEIIHRKLEGKLTLTVQRDREVFQVVLSLCVREIKNIWGQPLSVALIGITASDQTTILRYGPFGAFYQAGRRLLTLSVFTLRGMWGMVTGRMSFKESIAGPIGIAAIIGKTAKMGVIYLFSIMAIISTALAIFNLLPIPILDGGHIGFLILEKIRKRRLNARTQENIQNAAFAVIIVLLLIVSYNDILRLAGK